MKLLIFGLALLLAIPAGCGASKQYVADEVAAAQARTEAKIKAV